MSKGLYSIKMKVKGANAAKQETYFMNETTKAIVKGGLRSIAASFPFAGSLAQAWNEHESFIRDKRTEEFFNDLKIRFSSLEDKLKSVENYLQTSGEFPALIERTIEKVQREASAAKRQMFAIALLRTLSKGTAQSFDEKVNIIEILDSLTESDLKTLKVFSNGQRTRVNELVSGSAFYRNEEALGQDASPLIVSLSKLESRGLIGETVPLNLAFDYPGDATHWVNRLRRRTYEILPFGKILLESIQELNPPPQSNKTSSV